MSLFEVRTASAALAKEGNFLSPAVRASSAIVREQGMSAKDCKCEQHINDTHTNTNTHICTDAHLA